jgi:hypothetical protein
MGFAASASRLRRLAYIELGTCGNVFISCVVENLAIEWSDPPFRR